MCECVFVDAVIKQNQTATVEELAIAEDLKYATWKGEIQGLEPDRQILTSDCR